jgi:hypothetical protein
MSLVREFRKGTKQVAKMALDPKQASSAIERVRELTFQLQDTPLSQFSQQDVEAVVAAVMDDSG